MDHTSLQAFCSSTALLWFSVVVGNSLSVTQRRKPRSHACACGCGNIVLGVLNVWWRHKEGFLKGGLECSGQWDVVRCGGPGALFVTFLEEKKQNPASASLTYWSGAALWLTPEQYWSRSIFHFICLSILRQAVPWQGQIRKDVNVNDLSISNF